jgi:hypothetical protein
MRPTLLLVPRGDSGVLALPPIGSSGAHVSCLCTAGIGSSGAALLLVGRPKQASRTTEPSRSLVDEGERVGAAMGGSGACLRVDPTAARRED